MEIVQQIISKISLSSSLLIVVSGTNGDSLASGLALYSFLKKLEKDVSLLASPQIDPKYSFLPGTDKVLERIDLKKNFVIDVSTKKTKLAELGYKKDPDKLSIFLKPVLGEFKAEDVSFGASAFPFDLMILIGITNLESLGEFYSRHTALFFEIPIINIDFKADNENYGQFNLVELTHTSASEIVLDLINKFESSLIDEQIATQLLAGIIVQTNSFQHVRTTPQTFLKASQLVSLGAKQQQIVSNLYKSKSLGLLKLWGRVLARLKQEQQINLVYSAITKADLTRSEATDEEVLGILPEMTANLGFAKIFLFLKEETETSVTAFCHSNLPLNLNLLFGQFSPKVLNSQAVVFLVNQPLAACEKLLLEILQKEVGKLKTSF